MSWALLSGAARRIWGFIEAAVRRAAALPSLFKSLRQVEPALTYKDLEEAAQIMDFSLSAGRELEARYYVADIFMPEEKWFWGEQWGRLSMREKVEAIEAKIIERGLEEPERVFDIIPDELCHYVRYLRPGYYNVTLKYKIMDAISGEEAEGFWTVKLFGAPSLQRAISQMLSGMQACESPPCLENKVLLGASFYNCLRG